MENPENGAALEDQVNEVASDENAFEATSLSMTEFEELADIDLESALDGEADIEEAGDVSLDLTHAAGQYVGHPKFDYRAEGAMSMISSNATGTAEYAVSQINIPMVLSGQLSIKGDKQPKLVNKMVFVRLFLAWVDKESGEIKYNEQNKTQLYRLASAWFSAKHNAGKPESEWISAKTAFATLSKHSVMKVIVNVFHTAPDEEITNFMEIPVTEYTEKAQYEKGKDGGFLKDDNGENIVKYEARKVNGINFNRYSKMVNANAKMDDITAVSS